MPDDGGMAFPCQHFREQLTNYGDVSGLELAGRDSGMSLHDWYAGLAMQSIVLAQLTNVVCRDVMRESLDTVYATLEEATADMASNFANAMIAYKNSKEADGDGNGTPLPGS
jgi:hypothetical protein